jgi:hypothetical protein|tara:strand:- start:1021 stop:1785 length:765 start_codon:yes stop_codon:yes gene_type:complete
MKIAIAQLYTKNLDEWACIAVDNKRRYARLNNYDLVSKRGLYKTKPKRHPSWHSLSLILEILETSNVDWVFWSDVDALIMDQTVKLESFIRPDCDIIIPSQGKGEYCGIKTNNCLCCGHYFIKNTRWSKDFLRHLWKWPEGEFDKYKNHGYWEQCGMNYMFNENEMDFDKHVHIEKQNRSFNSFYFMDDYKHESMEFKEWGESFFRTKESKKELENGLGTAYNEGDFIIHFAGKHCAPYRKHLMEQYSEKVKWN